MIRIEHARLMSAFRSAAAFSLFSPAFTVSCGGGGQADVVDSALEPDATMPVEAGEGGESAISDVATLDGDTNVVADGGPDGVSDAAVNDSMFSEACAPVHAEADAGASETASKCARDYVLPCGLPTGRAPTTNCSFGGGDCRYMCGTLFANSCKITGDGCLDGGTVADGGPLLLSCDVCGVLGRRPPCLRAHRTHGAARDLGAYFSAMAHLEAASVPAFRRIARELRAFGAPRELIRGATSAARDEIRHARATTRLARRFGGQPRAPRVGRMPPRSLEEFARDNETEGCVRETFAALVAQVQAAGARDAEVASAFTHIAADEARHAALSWAIAGWVRARLSATARARLDDARRAAVEGLLAELGAVSPRIASMAGHPSPRAQQQLARALIAAVWTA